MLKPRSRIGSARGQKVTTSGWNVLPFIINCAGDSNARTSCRSALHSVHSRQITCLSWLACCLVRSLIRADNVYACRRQREQPVEPVQSRRRMMVPLFRTPFGLHCTLAACPD
jgi:hypothetical protein